MLTVRHCKSALLSLAMCVCMCLCAGGGYSAARADAEHHASMRSQFFQKAAEARSSKKYNVASYYAQQVRTSCYGR